MRRKLSPRILLAFALVSVSSFQASAMTYNLTLSDLAGQTGTGTLVINGSPSASGISSFAAGSGLTSLNFNFDGYNFSLANAAYYTPSVTFTNATLTSITYLGGLNGVVLNLGTSLNTLAPIPGIAEVAVGASPVSATPLPDGLPLFATGIGLIAIISWWRKRQAQVV
jgi:hypothetical protein